MSLQASQQVLRELIKEMLTDSPKSAQVITESLLGRGFSLGQIKQAKKHLPIVSYKDRGFGGLWYWKLKEEGDQ